MNIAERKIACLVIGYLFGCFLTAEAVVRKYTGKSVFTTGTHNPGMANVMANLGFVPGIETLSGDLAKAVAAAVLCEVLFGRGSAGIGWKACALYAELGTTLGHDFPFWHHFSGGKGVATSCMGFFLIHPLWGLVSDILGMLVVFGTGYLCVGGIVIPAAFTAFAFWRMGTEAGVIGIIFILLALKGHFSEVLKIRSGNIQKVDVPGLIREKLLHHPKEQG